VLILLYVRTLTELKVEDRSHICNYLILLSLEFSALSFQFRSSKKCQQMIMILINNIVKAYP
jgi:hypothetical protein